MLISLFNFYLFSISSWLSVVSIISYFREERDVRFCKALGKSKIIPDESTVKMLPF